MLASAVYKSSACGYASDVTSPHADLRIFMSRLLGRPVCIKTLAQQMFLSHTIETAGHTIAGRRPFVTPGRFFCLFFQISVIPLLAADAMLVCLIVLLHFSSFAQWRNQSPN